MSSTGGNGQLPPLHRLSSTDRGSIILIVAYSWVFLTALVAFVRFGSAVNQRVRFGRDDGAYAVATVFSIVSSICFHIAVNGGLGKHIDAVPAHRLSLFYKMTYTASLTGITAMASAKASVVLLSDRVAPSSPRQRFSILALISLWFIFSIFAQAFQCPTPRPWVYVPGKCDSRPGLLYTIIVTNIVTDVMVASWILPTLWKLLMNMERRVKVIFLFSTRLVVCAAAVGQLVSAAQHMKSLDQTWYRFDTTIWEICLINLSVVLATLPRTQRFLSSLHTTHATTQLTDFELSLPSAQPSAQQTPLDRSVNHGSGNHVLPNGAADASPNHVARAASSRGRSAQSHTPLFGGGRRESRRGKEQIKLIPSSERGNVHTTVEAGIDPSTRGKSKKRFRKYSSDEWKRFMGISALSSLGGGTSKGTSMLGTGLGSTVDERERERERGPPAPRIRRNTRQDLMQVLRNRGVVKEGEGGGGEGDLAVGEGVDGRKEDQKTKETEKEGTEEKEDEAPDEGESSKKGGAGPGPSERQ